MFFFFKVINITLLFYLLSYFYVKNFCSVIEMYSWLYFLKVQFPKKEYTGTFKSTFVVESTCTCPFKVLLPGSAPGHVLF